MIIWGQPIFQDKILKVKSVACKFQTEKKYRNKVVEKEVKLTYLIAHSI
jgi:hypothetical protein